MVIPRGKLKRASVPVLLTNPGSPGEPAKVVSAPDGVILLMTLRPKSATNVVADESTTSPRGELNRAWAPLPSAYPAVSARPARVVASPDVDSLRMVWWAGPAMETLPERSTAIPDGKLKRALLK